MLRRLRPLFRYLEVKDPKVRRRAGRSFFAQANVFLEDRSGLAAGKENTFRSARSRRNVRNIKGSASPQIRGSRSFQRTVCSVVCAVKIGNRENGRSLGNRENVIRFESAG